MKTKKLSEIRELLESDDLHTWFERYKDLCGQIEAAHRSYSDRLPHLIWRAGELEDASAHAHADYVELEESFEFLSDFEVQRQHTSDLWMEMQGREKALEDQRSVASELRIRIGAQNKGRRMTANLTEIERRKTTLSDLETSIETGAQEIEALQNSFEVATKERDAIWTDVETQWSDAFRANMARAEHMYAAQRVRAEAAKVAEGEVEPVAERTDADQALTEKIKGLEAELVEHLEVGEKKLDCTLVREFLYWPQQDDVMAAVCVPLIDEHDHLNVQVTALNVYQIERARGIEFLEPFPESDERSEDPRLETFFTRPTA